MPRPRPLPGGESAKRTLAHRLTRRADRLRQFYTRFGTRSKRVYLVWTRFTGVERGEGDEVELARVELLPTPRVSDLTAISHNPFRHGTYPEGSIRVDQISCGAYTEDNLMGLRVPGLEAVDVAPRPTRGTLVGGTVAAPTSDPRVDFFWEVVDDGRSAVAAEPPQESRKRYRLLGGPYRKETSLYWAANLQRVSEDLDRLGDTQIDDDDAWD